MRQSYLETNRIIKQYYTKVAAMQESVNVMQTKLARNEQRLSVLAKEHPKMVEKAVNEAVEKRMSCIVAASKGQRQVMINGRLEDCN